MGRHSSEQQWPFYRSVVVWFAPWVVIGAVVVAALWIGLGAIVGGGGGPSHHASAAAVSPKPSVTETPSETPSTSPTREVTPTPQVTRKPKPKPKPTKKPALITKGVSVQVLNATGVTEAGQRMADRLASEGFQIVAVGSAFGHYTKTTVFWATPSAKPAAEALAGHFGWEEGPKPANLSSTVDVHVIVGDDEANSP